MLLTIACADLHDSCSKRLIEQCIHRYLRNILHFYGIFTRFKDFLELIWQLAVNVLNKV